MFQCIQSTMYTFRISGNTFFSIICLILFTQLLLFCTHNRLHCDCSFAPFISVFFSFIFHPSWHLPTADGKKCFFFNFFLFIVAYKFGIILSSTTSSSSLLLFAWANFAVIFSQIFRFFPFWAFFFCTIRILEPNLLHWAKRLMLRIK